MCAECARLDEKISTYQRFLKQPFDPLTVQRIGVAIQEMERRKATLHNEALKK
jgi:hypothetical protein